MKKLNVLMFLVFAVVVAGCGKTTDMVNTDDAAMMSGDTVVVEETTEMTTEETTEMTANPEEMNVEVEAEATTTDETTEEIINMMNDAVTESESAN